MVLHCEHALLVGTAKHAYVRAHGSVRIDVEVNAKRAVRYRVDAHLRRLYPLHSAINPAEERVVRGKRGKIRIPPVVRDDLENVVCCGKQFRGLDRERGERARVAPRMAAVYVDLRLARHALEPDELPHAGSRVWKPARIARGLAHIRVRRNRHSVLRRRFARGRAIRAVERVPRVRHAHLLAVAQPPGTGERKRPPRLRQRRN